MPIEPYGGGYIRGIKDSNAAVLLMSMMDYPSNSTEYRLAATSLQNHLRDLMSDENKSFICPHSDWFGHPPNSDIEVDFTICRFCGIKNICVLSKPSKRISLTINKITQNDILPAQKEFEKCFSAVDLDGLVSKFDPFVGFSLESNISRDLFAISKSSFNRFFGELNNSKYHPTAIQHIIGFELKNGTALWAIDQRFLKIRFEMKYKFLKVLRQASNSQNNNISDLEFSFVLRIAAELKWVCGSEAHLFPALRNLFSDLTHLLKQIKTPIDSAINLRSIEKLSKSSMKPLIDIPFKENCTGMIDLALRWAELCPQDINSYMVHCDKSHTTYLNKKIIVERIIGDTKNQHSLGDEKIRYLPRLPMIVLASEKHLPLINLNSTHGRIIDLVIANVAEPFLLIDSLGINLIRLWGND